MGSFVSAHRLSSCSMWTQLLCSTWDPSSLPWDQIHIPCITRQILNHWTNFFEKLYLICFPSSSNFSVVVSLRVAVHRCVSGLPKWRQNDPPHLRTEALGSGCLFSNPGSITHLGLTMGRWGFPSGSDTKESACSAGDPVQSLGWEDSSGEGSGNSLQYSCLENPMDKGAWRATVHGGHRIRHDWATYTHTHTQWADYLFKYLFHDLQNTDDTNTSLTVSLWRLNKVIHRKYQALLLWQ